MVPVFDFDDTLTRGSEGAKWRGFWGVFQEDGPEALQAAEAYVRAHYGVPRRQMIEGTVAELARRGIRVKKNPEVLLDEFARLAEKVAIEAPPRLGAETVLKVLSQTTRVYLNSQTPQESIVRIQIARRWRDYFQRIFGSPPGTKKEHLATIIAAEGVDPDQVVVIGDGASDLEAAMALRTRFIGVRGEFSKFEANEPFPIIEGDLEPILPLLR